MFKETEVQLRARALRAAAAHLRDEAQVVLDPAHLWEDEGGGSLQEYVQTSYGTVNRVDRGGPRGCVAGWIYCEWMRLGLSTELGLVQRQIQEAIGQDLADAFGASRRDADNWASVVTRALDGRGAERCADMLDEVAGRIAAEALVPA